jgi:NitT/TauT family transport system ATP-binding protein
VTLDAVGRRFGAGRTSVHALEAVSLSVESGEFVSILGPSGCGKSTLLRIIAGLIPASSGSVWLAEERVVGPRDDVAMVFQSPALLPWRTVLPNIELPVEVKGLARTAHRERARALIKLVGLEGFEDRYPYQLSGGMQQRVSLCRALVCDPRVVLMDEPFGALDAITREQMNVELQRIWLEKRTTIVFVTHSIPEAIFLSDRILVMSSRPGTIKSQVTVPFGRPRGLDVFKTEATWTLADALRGELTD